jgi:hypothetical protein
MSDSVDDLNRMPSIALADAKGSRGRAGRSIGNLDRLEETDQLPADKDEPSTVPPADPLNTSARANASADSCKHRMQHRSDAAAAAADAQSTAMDAASEWPLGCSINLLMAPSGRQHEASPRPRRWS